MTLNNEEFKVLGQLANASNATLLVEKVGTKYIYKPQSGERELWDFPTGTLYQRERAAYVAAQLFNWDFVPETTIEHGPFGIGSLQLWQESEITEVDIFAPDEIPTDWLKVFSGVDEHGQQVILAHSRDSQLEKICLFDAVINNADRKAGHLLTDASGKVWAVDHGVTFNEEPKLRTVLWGWIGEPISTDLIIDLKSGLQKIDQSELTELLSEIELIELTNRIEQTISAGRYPAPNPNWPAVPWPVF